MVRVQKNYIPDEEVDGGEFVQYLLWYFADVETITSTNFNKLLRKKKEKSYTSKKKTIQVFLNNKKII